MNTATYVDVEGPVRAWLRGLNLNDVGARVFIGLPERNAFPAISLALIDGRLDAGEAPLANPVITFSVWGGSRSQAAAIVWALCSAIGSVRSVDLTSLRLMGAEVITGPVFRPDPDGKPRYVVDAAFAVVAQ